LKLTKAKCHKHHFHMTDKHIHNQGTIFLPQDSRILFLLSFKSKSKWNKFKWEILDNLNYDNFHGGGVFSHPYVIMHKYFVKNPKM